MSAYVDLKIVGPTQQDKKVKKGIDLLLRMAEQQMKEISDFVEAQTAFNQRMQASISSIEAKVQQLMNAPSGISLEELQALDNARTATEQLTNRVEALDASIPAVQTVN